MTRATTITASSRHDTGQLCKARACGLGRWKFVDFLACLLSPARSLAPTSPWFPTAYVLAGYALKPCHCRGTDAVGTTETSGPAAPLGAAVTLNRQCVKYPT